MKVKIKSEINIDVAFKLRDYEFLFAVDLFKWSLFKTKKTEAGYKAVHVLCFVFAILDRVVFDKWVDDNFGQLIQYEHEFDGDRREDVM